MHRHRIYISSPTTLLIESLNFQTKQMMMMMKNLQRVATRGCTSESSNLESVAPMATHLTAEDALICSTHFYSLLLQNPTQSQALSCIVKHTTSSKCSIIRKLQTLLQYPHPPKLTPYHLLLSGSWRSVAQLNLVLGSLIPIDFLTHTPAQ